ncbi:MAG: hypothetical protein JRF40_14690 [Deltaproteobacteria bacterium]|nr:hypothetical protein [Deltaproteobacteria bacterium]
MGKKSLLKSTSKKKAAPKKTITKKTAAKKKAGAKKNTAKKTTPKKKAAAKKKSNVGTTKGPAVKKTSGAKPVADTKEEKTTPEIENITPEEKPKATRMEEENTGLIAGKKAEPVDKVTEEETPAVVIQGEEHTKDTNSEESETAGKLYEEKATETVIQDEEGTVDTTIKKPETDEEFKNEIAGPTASDAIEELTPAPASTIHKTIHSDPEISLPPDKTAHENADTGKMPIIFGAALLVIIMILITGISISNSKKYYLEYRNGAIKIFKGTFEPVGKSLLIILPGVEAPKPAKAVYSKEEIYPIISKYYINKAATLLEVPGMPDFKGVKIYLQKATKFATSEKLLNEAERRIKSIDFMVLIYKADLMEDTGTLSGLQDASRYLKEAASINTDKAEAEIVEKKIAAVQKLIDDIKKKTAKNPEISPGDAKDKSK